MAKQRRTNNAKFNGNQNSNSGQAHAKHNKGGNAKKIKKFVDIYTSIGCPHCQDAKMYMQMNKIKFTEYNLDRQQGAEKKFLAMGGKRVPLLLVNGKLLRAWNQQAFDKAYNS
jgi:glutaredoxin